MSFSGGGKTQSSTSNEQNPITATDSAIVANEGSYVTVTDGGAFNVIANSVRDVLNSNNNAVQSSISSNQAIADQAMQTGLNYYDTGINFAGDIVKGSNELAGQSMLTGLTYFDKAISSLGNLTTKVIDSVGASTTQLFDSQKTDELNKSENFQNTLVKLGTATAVVVSLYVVAKYAFK